MPNTNQPQPFPYDVFLSYSHQDKKTVHRLAERLKADGLRVWLDDWVIKPGDSIPLKIAHGVEGSRVLLLCMSPAYFDSQWGQLEHHTMVFRDPANTERRFIPLLLADCQPPAILAQFARIDWRGENDAEYQRLLAACGPGSKSAGQDSAAPGPEASGARESGADQCRMVLKGHKDRVYCVAVTPDGGTVVSASYDKTLKVWALATGQCLATLQGHTCSVNGLAITPDGRTVISGSGDGTLRVWDMP